MQNDAVTLNLALDDAQADSLPGLSVQSRAGAPPDYSVELYRLYLAVQGDVSLCLDSQPVILKRGHLLTLSPGESVQFDETAAVRSLSFHHNFFCVRVQRDEVYCDGVVFNRLTGLPIVAFPEDEQAVLHGRLDELHRILDDQGPFSADRALSALRALLLHAADFKLRSCEAMSGISAQQAQLSTLVLDFQKLVERTYTERREASFYSDALAVAPATLNRRVKEELGQTVMQTVSERLAIAARVALRSGKQSVKEVAFDLGFDDPLYFSRFFRKHFGSPPSQYFENVGDGKS